MLVVRYLFEVYRATLIPRLQVSVKEDGTDGMCNYFECVRIATGAACNYR